MIAVTSQNRKTVTEHAGRCRRFWIYETAGSEVKDRTLLKLPIEQTLHEHPLGGPHPLDDVHVLITAGMGTGLRERLQRRGILAVATTVTDPDQAVAAWLRGTLPAAAPQEHARHHDHHPHHQS